MSSLGLYKLWGSAPIANLLQGVQFLNKGALFSASYIAVILMSTLSLLFLILKCDLIFPMQIGAGLLGVSLKIFKLFAVADYPVRIPAIIWILTFVAAAIFANAKYRASYFPLFTSRRMRTKFFDPRSPGRFRILFIEPALKRDRVASTSRRMIYPSTTPYLAALVPENWDPMIIDILYDKIDYDIDVDVVAITSMALNFKTVGEIATQFRLRGKTVIFGGADPSRQPDSYLNFCDSVLIGAGEDFLPQMLQDWQHGTLQIKYNNTVIHNLKNMPLPRYDLLPLMRYHNMHNILVSTSCPFNCSFCKYNRTRESRLRPVEDVMKAIQATPAKYFWFEAPELLIYKAYIRELNSSLKGKGIHWATHASMKSSSDPQTLKVAFQAGLRSVLIGVESFNTETLKFFNKKMNVVAEYQNTFDLLNKAGISVSVHLIFGAYTDTVEDFKNAILGLVKGKVSMVHVHHMAAAAGDEEFERELVAKGSAEYDGLKKYNMRSRYGMTLYRAAKFTDFEMMNHLNNFHKEFYSLTNILNRVVFRSWKNFGNLLPDFNENIHNSILRRSHSGCSFDLYQSISEFIDESREEVARSFEEVLVEKDSFHVGS